MINQGSIEWMNARLGNCNASKVANIMAKTKTGVSEKRKRYLTEIVAERLTGQPTDVFVTSAMQRGIDLEPQARKIVAKTMNDFEVIEAGYYKHPTIERAGASPDGLIGKFGLLEIKCMGTYNHTKFLIDGKIPPEHKWQMQMQMACLPERMFCIYVAYNPDFPVKHQLGVQKVHRDNQKIKELETEIISFLSEVEVILTKIKGE